MTKAFQALEMCSQQYPFLAINGLSMLENGLVASRFVPFSLACFEQKKHKQSSAHVFSCESTASTWVYSAL